MIKRDKMGFIPKQFTIIIFTSFGFVFSQPIHKVYVVCGNYEIQNYSQNLLRGELTYENSETIPGTALSMITNKAKQIMYVGTRGANAHQISAYSINKSNGNLTFLNQLSVPQGPVLLTLDRTEKYLFSAPWGVQTVSQLSVAIDGKLNSLVRNIDTDANPHAAITDHSNNYLFITNLGDDNIHRYSFDDSDGSLTPLNPFKINTPPNSGPRLAIFHSKNNWMYVGNEYTNTVRGYSVDSNSGTLTEINMQSTIPLNYNGNTTLSELHLTPDNKFLYVANRGHNSIAGYQVNPNTGALTLIDYFPTGPVVRSFTIDSFGKYLYAASSGNSEVITYEIQPQTGRLSPIDTLSVGNAPSFILSLTLEWPSSISSESIRRKPWTVVSEGIKFQFDEPVKDVAFFNVMGMQKKMVPKNPKEIVIPEEILSDILLVRISLTNGSVKFFKGPFM